jgi:hypothetical protein
VIVTLSSICGQSDVVSLTSCPQDNAACVYDFSDPVDNCQGKRSCSLDALQALTSCRALVVPGCGGVSYIHVDYFCLPREYAETRGCPLDQGVSPSVQQLRLEHLRTPRELRTHCWLHHHRRLPSVRRQR